MNVIQNFELLTKSAFKFKKVLSRGMSIVKTKKHTNMAKPRKL